MCMYGSGMDVFNVHGRRKRFSRSATNTLILSSGCRHRGCCCCCRWHYFCILLMSVCPYSGASVLSSSHVVLTAFVEYGRKNLSPACVKYSASFRDSRADHGGRTMHCVACRSGWIYFHTFSSEEIVVAGSRARRRHHHHHHHRHRALVFVCWAILFLLVNQKRSTKVEEKENLKWMWMMYWRYEEARIIPFLWHRPIHTPYPPLSQHTHTHIGITFIHKAVFAKVCTKIYHLVGCLPFGLLSRLDIHLLLRMWRTRWMCWRAGNVSVYSHGMLKYTCISIDRTHGRKENACT